jgi:nucleotide-binding universal stress UspA family protein
LNGARRGSLPCRTGTVTAVTSARDKFGDFGLLYEYESMAQALAEERELAKAYLADMVRIIEAEGYPVSATLVDGIAAKAIVGMTEPGDVIVMATHGRTGMKRWFIGSIAEDVLRHATVPVLLVRAMDIAPAAERAA